MNSCKFEEEKKLDALIQSMGGAEAVVNDDEKSKDVAEAMYNGVEALNLLLHKQTHKNQDDQKSKLDSQSSKLDSQSSKLDEHKCALENMQKALHSRHATGGPLAGADYEGTVRDFQRWIAKRSAELA